MASSSSRTRSSGPVLRSLSPSRTFYPYSTHQQNNNNRNRSASPTRVNLCTPSAPLSPGAVRFANRTVSSHVITRNSHRHHDTKKSCMCSPTTHPGSFRCSLHKNNDNSSSSGASHRHHQNDAVSWPSNRLNMRRSAMKNSLVRIGGVEGEWVKRALTALIRPSSHHQRRRAAFEPRPSRLSHVSTS